MNDSATNYWFFLNVELSKIPDKEWYIDQHDDSEHNYSEHEMDWLLVVNCKYKLNYSG